MNKYPASLANHLSAYGRYGDDQLVHMNSQEVAALDGIAAAFGRELTRNPHTGMKEAFNLFDILPIALNFIPGIGTAASIALSAASGAASSAIEGGDPLEGALLGGITGAVGAGLGGSAADAAAGAAKEVGAEALAKIPDVTPEMAKAMGMPAEQAAKIAMDASAAQAAATPLGGTFIDIFGKGTDAQLQTALAAPFKAENLPLTYLGATALSSLPDIFGQDQGTGNPEYKYIPEQFPGSPRVVNPDYDPTMAAFGEQDAFSSGVDYARGYADGGEVKKGGGGFNIEGMLGGVIPMIIDGFTDGNKYGSGILGMLFNERKPWEYGRDKGGPQPMMQGPSTSIPAPGSSMPSPISGFAYGGPVRGYKGGGQVGQMDQYYPAPEGMMWDVSTQPGGRNMGKRGRGQLLPQLVPNPNYRRRERNIQQTNPNSLYAGGSPLIGDVPMTQVPLPGGEMGAPPPAMGMSSPAAMGMPSPAPNYSSFEIATSPTGEMPASGGGMGGQGYQGGAQQGGKGGRSGEGGGKRGNIGEYVLTDPKQRDAPQINPGNQDAALGQGSPLDQRYNEFLNNRNSERSNLQFYSNLLRGGQTPPSTQPSEPAQSPAPNLGITASMPGAATSVPGQAAAQPEQPSTLPPMGAGVGMGMAYGGRVRGYANGGMVDQAMQLDDRTVVKEAMAALAGQSPNPEEAIAMFVDRFGEDALQALIQKMQGGMQGGMQGRYMQGPGDGLSDSIPATVDGQQPSALSSGEFVIPADAVSHLGNGSNEAGAKELYSMIDRLRQARTGSPTPPPAIDQRGVMPA